MISLEEFGVLADQIADEIPAIFYEGLNGGIQLKEEEKLHPLSREKAPVYILGLYIKDDFMGSRIEIRDVMRHEFQHHVEIMCGNMDLIQEDEKELNKIRRRRKKD